MGRYCEFSTGVSYKFAFGIQDTNDIVLYYGTSPRENEHEWESGEMEWVLNKVKVFARDAHIPLPDFEKYLKDADGTETMIDDFYEQTRHIQSAWVYTILLGCVIYHQLTYTEKLTCTYDY